MCGNISRRHDRPLSEQIEERRPDEQKQARDQPDAEEAPASAGIHQFPGPRLARGSGLTNSRHLVQDHREHVKSDQAKEQDRRRYVQDKPPSENALQTQVHVEVRFVLNDRSQIVNPCLVSGAKKGPETDQWRH